MFEHNVRYLQIAFNKDLSSAYRILSAIPRSERILIEAGTPFIKREGFRGISEISRRWQGRVVADLKTTDGAVGEVELAYSAGATAATVAGSAPAETINLFIAKCNEFGMDSMIDMLGVDDPLKVMLKLKLPPKVVVVHRGRDEEGTKGKVIKYKHINKIRSKYDVLISVAGGVDLREASSAVFNGANIVVANIINPEDPWKGIKSDSDVAEMARQFLENID